MSGKMQEIGIVIKAEVDGQQSIGQLAQELEDIAKVAGGDLAVAANAAATRMRELANQDAAVNSFLALRSEVAASTKAMNAASMEAANYARQIGQVGPPTAQEAAALQRLELAAQGARGELARQQQALSAAQAGLQRYGIAGQSVEQAQRRLREEVDLVRGSVAEIAPAYQRAASGAQEAGSAMVRTHRQIGDGVESISAQLARLQSVTAGLVGLQGFKAMAQDLAATADQVSNLQARLKLVTGDGAAFGTAWAGVQAVALSTNSALEETGTLFSRLAQAGKDAGQGGADAIASALGLTETINQAIQLSGASSQASSAAITQLIQGLQGGVLRGDEFNSVMEQSPRLARALADGLGVTTGELRKMAEAGALTSGTVIGALKGQSDVIAAEFSKLPATVGRALQNLSTQWTLYVAETDKATGASQGAATAINALSGNLKTIAGLLIDAGQAVAAFAALRLAQHFLGIGTAAQQAAVAVAAHNAQLAASGAAATAAAAGASRFAVALATLRTFTLVGLAANFKDIGTWIGESAAKLAGYKDRTDELARADKLAADIVKEAAADRTRLALATQAAIDKQFQLSKEARAGVAEFEKLTQEGKNTAEALHKATDAFDLSKTQGVKDFAAVLDKLAATGKLTAGELAAAWSKALNGKDLAQFEVTARAAFSGSAREGERVAQMMDSVLLEAVRRTGLAFYDLNGVMGSAARSAINDVDVLIAGMDKLRQKGVDTSVALAASLSKAISTADSEAALEVLLGKIEEVRKVLGDRVADGLLDQAKQKARELGDEMDKILPGINSVAEAMKILGVKSDESLKQTADRAKDAYDVISNSGRASARELVEAFKKAAEAAIAANNGVAPSWVEAGAAMRGFSIEVDKAGKSTLRLNEATDKAAAAHSRAAHATREQMTELERLNAAKEREIAAQEKANQLLEREDALRRKRWNVDKEGFTLDSNGQRQQQSLPTGNFVFDTAKSQGLSEKIALELMDRFFQNGKGVGTESGSDWFSTVNKAIAERVLEEARKRITQDGAPASPPPAPVPAPAPGGHRGDAETLPGTNRGETGITHIVNISVDTGSSHSIPTNSLGADKLRNVAGEVLHAIETARWQAGR